MKISFTNRIIKFSIITLIILLISEIFIFNYKSFLINPANSSRYIHQDYKITDTSLTNLSYSDETGAYEVTGDNPYISISMDTPVKTIFLDAHSLSNPEEELLVDIAYSTESRTDIIKSNKTFSLVETIPQSKYATCNYSGNVQTIILAFDVEVGDMLQLNSLSLNKKIPFHFSFVRILVLFLLSIAIFLLFKYPAFKDSFNLQRRSHRYAITFTLVAFLLFVIFIYHMYVGDYYWTQNTYGNQMTQELVDAFENGQVHLLDEVPEELLNLENPYDWNERIAGNFSYKWDHLLFEGKYYSYYGIAPVLTLFLPYHMITGYYFPSSLACLLYTLLASLFIGLSFISIVKNWFNNTPFRIALLGTITAMFSSCAIICVLATNFYEIAQSSALCFLVIGLYFMLNSGVFTKNNIRLSYLFLSSLFVSLAVLSRATCSLYAIAMVCWIIYGFFQYKNSKNNSKTWACKYIIASMLPYVVFGIVQMLYNYLRFKNPFDFGIVYSLTINDFTRTEMHFGLVMISIVNFLFAIPIVNSTFPFVHGNFDSLGVNGYYYIATKPTIGIFPSILPTLAIFYAPKLAGNFNLKEKIKLFFTWFLPGIIIPVILVVVTWESGYAMRYGADFSWQLCFAAFVVIFYVYNKLKNETIKKWLFRILFISTVWCVICYLAVLFTTSPADAVAHNMNGAEIFYKLRHLIVFWN